MGSSIWLTDCSNCKQLEKRIKELEQEIEELHLEIMETRELAEMHNYD